MMTAIRVRFTSFFFFFLGLSFVIQSSQEDLGLVDDGSHVRFGIVFHNCFHAHLPTTVIANSTDAPVLAVESSVGAAAAFCYVYCEFCPCMIRYWRESFSSCRELGHIGTRI